MVDLHVHTTMSDGQYSPCEVVRSAHSRGISTLAITDHDTVSGVKEGMAAAQEAGIEFISGIEISAEYDREVHVLGYCIDINNSELLAACSLLEEQRFIRSQQILGYLNEKGVALSYSDVKKHVTHGRIGRPHFAHAMLEAGYVSDFRDAFNRYLATQEFDEIEYPRMVLADGIDLIRKAGGVPVLAHPALLKQKKEEFEKFLRELIDLGVKGIECHYSMHSLEQTELYLSLAKKYDLVVTGGSDFHGEDIVPDIELGTGIKNSLLFDGNNVIQRLEDKR